MKCAAVICPDKITTAQWLDVMKAAHAVGLGSTATIMFGHVDRPEHWARHLLRVRDLQEETGGFSEFVPLPFVPLETPIFLKQRARPGPTYREAVLMHAIARLALNPLVKNIQTSWVKMGPEGAAACLAAGANDLGGTLMNETITRSAGATHGQEFSPERIEALVRGIGREPRQRTTSYATPQEERQASSFGATAIADPVNTPARGVRTTTQAGRNGARRSAMKFGVNTAPRGLTVSREAYKSIAQAAESFGYDFLSVSDHVVVPRSNDSDYPYSEDAKWGGGASGFSLEMLTTLSFLAGCTDRINLLSSVMVVPHRPALADRQDPCVDGPARQRPHPCRRRGRLAARGVRGVGDAAVRCPRQGHGRVHRSDGGAVDQGRAGIPG